MDPIIEAGAAAVPAGFLVALYKMASPQAQSAAVAGVSLAAGIASAFLVLAAAGALDAITVQGVAQGTLQGVGAAAIAAGLTRTDASAERGRAPKL